MKAVLYRDYTPYQTKGLFLVLNEGRVVTKSVTIEPPDNGNQKYTSCIPEGKYEVVKYNSPKFGKCFHVLNVMGRTDILIHAGNYKRDTKGCIIPGYCYSDLDGDGNMDVCESKKTVEVLLGLLPEKFELHII
jgi:hypothetical protein